MFLKLTENETSSDVYLNPDFIVRFVPNPAGDGTFIYMDGAAGLGPEGEPQMLAVHESAEEVFRMITRNNPAARAGGGRGLV